MADQLHLWDEPQDGLRWSLSRHNRLRECARRYFWHDVKARGGWDKSAPADRREAFVLRGLRTRYSWVGEVVHELIELALGALRRGEAVSADALVERGTRRMRAQYAESVQRVYRERPAQAFGLFEHEYGVEVTRAAWRGQRDRMEACVRRFFDLPMLAVLRATPAYRWLAVESLGSFELDGALIVVRPDFAWRDAEGRVVLVDWKTGAPRPDDERLQLSVYGLFARRAWGTGPGDLLGQVVHLGTGEVSEQRLTQGDLDAAEAFVRTAVGVMREAAARPAEPELFPMTDDVALCTLCPFRRLCGR